MDDKQNQPEFMVASMGVAHKQSSFHCVYTHFFLSFEQEAVGWRFNVKVMPTLGYSCSLETVLALQQMGGIFTGTILVQSFPPRKWGFKGKHRQLFRLQSLSFMQIWKMSWRTWSTLSPCIVGWISSCFQKSEPPQQIHNQTDFSSCIFFSWQGIRILFLYIDI